MLPRKQAREDNRGVDLISDVPPFDRFWYGEPNAVTNSIGYAQFSVALKDSISVCGSFRGTMAEVRMRRVAAAICAVVSAISGSNHFR